LDAVFRGIDMMSGVTRKISKGLDKISKSAAGTMAKINSASNAAAESLKRVALVAGATGIAVGAAAAHLGAAGADFEQAITDVGAVSLMTRKEVADLEKKAIELGGSTKFSATEVANGMELMGKAGFTNAQILEGIGGVLAAAAADGGELAETAGHIGNVLKGMGLEASETGRVADVLALASARTNSSIGSLGESMANVSSTARQFRVPLEDTIAAVAMLQDVGLDASEAGSAVNTMLTQMAAPSDKAKAKMKALGVSFTDANGDMLPFGKVLEQLQKSAQKSGGNMAQVAFFAELVGLRGQKAAANLKDLFTTGKFQSLVEELDNAAGSAKKMADIKMDTFRGDLETLGGSIDSVKVALFDTQSGPLRDVVKGMTKWVDANQKLVKSGFVEYIDKGKPIVETFVDGVKNGFNDMKPVLSFVKGIFTTLFGDSPAIVMAGVWGERITKLAIAVALFAVATKVAAGVMLVYTAATKAAAFATAIWTFVTKAAHAALLIYNLTRKAGIAYLIALVTGTQIETGAKVANTAATVTNSAAQATNNALTRGGAAAKAFFAISTKSSTAAAIANTTALKGAAAGMAAFALAAAAAIGAIMILNSQLDEFKSQNDGLGFGDFLSEWATTDKSMFEVVDDHMNKKARERAAAEQKAKGAGGMGGGVAAIGDTNAQLAQLTAQMETLNTQMASDMGGFDMSSMPGQLDVGQQMSGVDPSLAALENLQVTGPAEIVLPDRLARDDKMTITVRAEQGSEAEVTEKPQGKGTTIAVQRTGTY
jgi:TP901 family phage tail tape measure protein